MSTLTYGTGVNSLNSLTGPLNLVAGSNITLTPAGTSITIAATGGSPGGSNTQIQFNNSGSFGGDANFTYATSLVTMTANSLGHAAIPTNKGIFLVSTTAATSTVPQDSPPLYFIGNAYSTANDSTPGTRQQAYRIYESSTPANLLASQPAASTLNIDSSILTGLSGTFANIASFSAAKTIIASPTLQINQFLAQGAGTFQSIITVAGAATFNNSTTVNANLTVNGSSSFTYQVNANGPFIAYGSANFQQGLTSEAEILSNASSITTGNPSAATASLNLAYQPATPSPSASQGLPHLGSPTSFNETQDNAGSGFTANGSSYEYIVWSYNGLGQYCQVPLDSGTFSDDNSGNPFQWDLSWTPGTGLDTVTGYYLGRNINGGGLSYQDIGLTTSYTDNNQDPFSGTSPSVFTPDYIANGTTRTYTFSGYSTAFSPSGYNYYSNNSGTFGFTDDNSGNPYTGLITTTDQGGLNAWKIIGAPDGSSLNRSATGTTTSGFVDDSHAWSSSDLTLTPVGYGILANGSNLTATWNIYGASISGSSVFYSPSAASTSTTDPNDSQYYSVQLNYTAGAGNTKFKVLDPYLSNAIFFTVTNPSIDALTVWNQNTTVTPTSGPGNAGTFKNTALGSTDEAQLVIQSAASNYGRLDFLDYTGTQLAALEASGTQLKMFNANGSATLASNGYFNVAVAVNTQNLFTGSCTIGNHCYLPTSMPIINTGYPLVVDPTGFEIKRGSAPPQPNSTINGSTSGNAFFAEPYTNSLYLSSGANKKIMIYCTALVGTATYNFVQNFVHTPVVLNTTGLSSSLVTSLSTASVTVTGANSTGFLIIEGF